MAQVRDNVLASSARYAGVTARISATDLASRIEVRGNDDAAALARTFNHMLDRLERAFALQRRMLDDAGHELRTPLTVIRGHLDSQIGRGARFTLEIPDPTRATRPSHGQARSQTPVSSEAAR